MIVRLCVASRDCSHTKSQYFFWHIVPETTNIISNTHAGAAHIHIPRRDSDCITITRQTADRPKFRLLKLQVHCLLGCSWNVLSHHPTLPFRGFCSCNYWNLHILPSLRSQWKDHALNGKWGKSVLEHFIARLRVLIRLASDATST